MKGKIIYVLWTVMGDVKVDINYDIEMINGNMAMAHFRASAEVENTPELSRALQEVQEEITMLCLEDAQKREKKVKKVVTNPVEPEDYPRVLPGNLWGAN